MPIKYKEKTLRELHIVCERQWYIGDDDSLIKSFELMREIDHEFGLWIKDIVDFSVIRHVPFEKLKEVLTVFGYYAEEE